MWIVCYFWQKGRSLLHRIAQVGCQGTFCYLSAQQALASAVEYPVTNSLTRSSDTCSWCRRWHTVSNPTNVNPFPGAYLNASSSLRLKPITTGCQTLLELETDFLTDPAQAVSFCCHWLMCLTDDARYWAGQATTHHQNDEACMEQALALPVNITCSV